MSLASLPSPWLSFTGPWVSCCLNTMTLTIAASGESWVRGLGGAIPPAPGGLHKSKF